MEQHWMIPAAPVSDDPQRWDLHGLTKLEYIAIEMMKVQRRREDDGGFIHARDRASKAVSDAVALLEEIDRRTTISGDSTGE